MQMFREWTVYQMIIIIDIAQLFKKKIHTYSVLMLWLSLVLFGVIVLVGLLCANGNRSYIFVSGWPQSGTSLVQQLLTATPNVSTMVEGCQKVHGAKCVKFNHEGQWLLGKSSQVSSYFHPGEACPIQKIGEVMPPAVKSTLLAEWGRYWDFKRNYLVEKSPQSLVKLFPLKQLVEGVSASTKFLIVLKHPVSLNLAPVYKYHWMHHMESQTLPSGGRRVARVDNTPQEKVANLDHFMTFIAGSSRYNNSYLDFLTAPASDNSFQSDMFHNCSVPSSWLAAMDYVYMQLQSKALDARIVRYEDLARPGVVCRQLMKFVFADDTPSYSAGIQKVCVDQLERMRPASEKKAAVAAQLASAHALGGIGARDGNSMHGKGHVRGRRPSEQNAPDSRQLRLLNYNTNSSVVAIDSKRLQASSVERLRSFQSLVDEAATPLHMRELAIVNRRLKNYGYNIFLSDYWQRRRQRLAAVPAALRLHLAGVVSNMGREQSSVLDPWDLMK